MTIPPVYCHWAKPFTDADKEQPRVINGVDNAQHHKHIMNQWAAFELTLCWRVYRGPSKHALKPTNVLSSRWFFFHRNICDLLCHCDADGVNLDALSILTPATQSNGVRHHFGTLASIRGMKWCNHSDCTTQSSDKTGLNCHTMRMKCAKSLNTLHWIRCVAFFARTKASSLHVIRYWIMICSKHTRCHEMDMKMLCLYRNQSGKLCIA